MWPKQKQIETILRKNTLSYQNEIEPIIENYLSDYKKSNVSLLNNHIHSLCQKKSLDQAFCYVAVYYLKFGKYFDEHGDDELCSITWTFEDLSIRFHYSEKPRDFDIYLYFADNCRYVPLMDFKLPRPKSTLQKEYSKRLTARLTDIQHNLLKQDESPLIEMLTANRQQIIYRQIVFENIKDFATSCLFLFKNGKVLNTLQLLRFYCLCKSNKELEEVILSDAAHLAIALLVCDDLKKNLLEEGIKIENYCSQEKKKVE